jgi:hypothetical protein
MTKIIDEYTNRIDLTRAQKYRLRHPDNPSDNWKKNHKEEAKVIAERYRLNHPEYDPAKWQKTHPEEYKAVVRKSMKKQRLKDPEKFRLRDEVNYKKDRKKRINSTVDARKNFRVKLIILLGNHCINPYNIDHSGFEADIDYMHCLQIDHVNGNGCQDRKETKDSYMMYRRMYKEVETGSKEYQLLCSNCNWLKRHKNEEFN